MVAQSLLSVQERVAGLVPTQRRHPLARQARLTLAAARRVLVSTDDLSAVEAAAIWSVAHGGDVCRAA